MIELMKIRWELAYDELEWAMNNLETDLETAIYSQQEQNEVLTDLQETEHAQNLAQNASNTSL